MLKESLLGSLYAKRASPEEFNFEALQAPSMYNFVSENDLAKIYDIVTSNKYSSKVEMKIKAIKQILEPRGFVSFANGTNRMCFRFLEDTSFIAKVPYKISGLDNGAREWRNQQLIKPFVAKTFEVHPSGIMSIHERVLPITNKEEYLSVIDDVFAMITAINGKYVLDDAGTKYFMNIGIRSGFGVVLLDYPDLFELDGRKLFCNRPIYPNTKTPVCGGLIDFDDGFNKLVCTKCGKSYSASELQKAKDNLQITMEGDINMKVSIMQGNKVIMTSEDITDTIVKPDPVKEVRPDKPIVSIRRGNVEQNLTKAEEYAPTEKRDEIHVDVAINRGAKETPVHAEGVETPVTNTAPTENNVSEPAVDNTPVSSQEEEPVVVGQTNTDDTEIFNNAMAVAINNSGYNKSKDLVKIKPNKPANKASYSSNNIKKEYNPKKDVEKIKRELGIDERVFEFAEHFVETNNLTISDLDEQSLRRILLQAKDTVDAIVRAESNTACNVLADNPKPAPTSTTVTAQNKPKEEDKTLPNKKQIINNKVLDSNFIPTGKNDSNIKFNY